MMQLPINEVFETIQGEGLWTGAPSIFVRLQGCDVGCPWCDTKHTWALGAKHEATVARVLAKPDSSAEWARMGWEDLSYLMVEKFTAGHIVITGGEPCQYDLTKLTEAMGANGYSVQIETSGTAEIRVASSAWVTVSPKIAMPGGFSVRHDAVARANEIKMPVGKPSDVSRLINFLAEHEVSKAVHVWLQPLSQSPKATELCIAAATEHGWRLSAQLHKYIGVR